MKKILVIDDRFGARENLRDELLDAFPGKVDLIACQNVYEADGAMESEQFDVIIVDSMMSTLGLAPEQEEFTQEGLYTGIVWLCGWFIKCPEKLENKKIYVVSGYLDDRDEIIDSMHKYTQTSDFIDNINFVSKAGDAVNKMIQDIGKTFNL